MTQTQEYRERVLRIELPPLEPIYMDCQIDFYIESLRQREFQLREAIEKIESLENELEAVRYGDEL